MSMGYDVRIDDTVKFVRPGLVTIGNHVAIDWCFYCTTQLDIGDYVHIASFVSCIGGKGTKFIAEGFNNIMSGVRIICGSDRFDDSGLFGAMIPPEFKGRQILGTVILEEFANIGTNAIVLPNSRLRKGVLLTAGSLLMGDTEEWGVYKGNPAVLVKKINGKKAMLYAKKIREDE
jgi:acetyltransferase-like isoleucine patch superfamily enzyme